MAIYGVNESTQRTIAPTSRKVSLDVIRSFAIFCVLICHATDMSYRYFDLTDIPFLSLYQRIFAIVLHIVGRCGVPLFFFLTGYLLLTRKFEGACDIVNFWKTHLIPLAVTCSIWGIVYYLFGILIKHNSFSIGRLFGELFFFQQYEGPQFWYIPCILGIYLFLPFIAIMLRSVDFWLLEVVWGFSFLAIFLFPTINPILKAAGKSIQLTSLLNLQWSGGSYGILVFIGYWMAEQKLKISVKKWLLLAGAGFLVLLLEENYCYAHGYAYDLWYDNLILTILCMAIFECILSLKKFPSIQAFQWISQNAFGIFLLHILFRDYVMIRTPDISHWRKFLILLTAMIIGSLATVWFLGINRRVRRILIRRK